MHSWGNCAKIDAMDIETIQLYPDDDINSMRDRLDWAKSGQVLFVLPENNRSEPYHDRALLTDEVDLGLLARHADALRMQVGLVSSDPAVRLKAAGFGFPTFLTVDLAETSPRAWRRHRVRPDGNGLNAIELEDAYEQVALRRVAAEKKRNRPQWQKWAKTTVFLVLGATCLTFFLAAIGLATPSATVTVKAAREKVTVQRTAIASINPTGNGQINGRNSSIIISWRSDIVPTGQAELGANPARGKIVFANKSDTPVVIPAGVRLGTDSDPSIEFQTAAPTELPAVIGGTVEVDILALEVGPQGNLPAGSLLNIIGTETEWGEWVDVRQPLPTSGGDIQPVPIVTEADRLALRTEMLQELQSLAGSEIEAALASSEFLSAESLAIQQIISENWSHQVGEKSERLSLTIEAEVSGIVVDLSQATDILYTDLVGIIRPGYSLTPDSFRFYKAGTTQLNEQGDVVFEMVGEGTMTALSDIEAILEEIAGKNEAEAIEILEANLDLDGTPVIRIIPNWFGRLPHLVSRIEVIEVGEG